MLFMITGCGNKTTNSSADFKSKMEDKGYAVQDATINLLLMIMYNKYI